MICVATLWIGLRSYTIGWGEAIEVGGVGIAFRVVGGNVVLEVNSFDRGWWLDKPSLAATERWIAPARGSVELPSATALHWRHWDFAPDFHVIAVAVPVPLFSCGLLLPSCVGLLRRRGEKRLAARGFCRSCGYDLRANTGRCPECGRSIPDKVFA